MDDNRLTTIFESMRTEVKDALLPDEGTAAEIEMLEAIDQEINQATDEITRLNSYNRLFNVNCSLKTACLFLYKTVNVFEVTVSLQTLVS